MEVSLYTAVITTWTGSLATGAPKTNLMRCRNDLGGESDNPSLCPRDVGGL